MEIISIVLMIIAIVIAIIFAASTTERIPIKYNFAGEVTGYGSAATAVMLPVMMLFTVLIMILIVHLCPKEFFNVPVKTRPETELKVYTDCIWMIAIMDLLMAIFTLWETISFINMSDGGILPTVIFVAAIFTDIIFFLVKIIMDNR